MNAIKSMLSSLKPPEDTPTVRLMKTIGFGGKDLDLNRQGQLSGSQKVNLHQVLFWRLCGALLITLFMASIFSTAYRQIPAELQASQPFFSFMAVCMAGFIYVIYRHRKNVATASVVAFTGRAKKNGASEASEIIVINYDDRTERIYTMKSRIYDAFLDGETYTVYSPSYNQNLIVAAEHVPGDSR